MELKEAVAEIAEKIEKVASVKAAFGEPYQQGETMIIPVAAVTLRGGGGGGFGEQPEGRPSTCGPGGGGGLGLRAESRPVGYIRVLAGQAHFEPVFDASMLWNRLALFGGLAFALFMWGAGRAMAKRS